MTAKEKLKSLYIEYFKDEKWLNPNDITDSELVDFLNESNTVSQVVTSGSRWWDNIEKVADVEGLGYFKYEWAKTTGDMTAREAGWEFDWNSLAEVEPYTETVTITRYRLK